MRVYCSVEEMAAALQFPFTTAQWKELERQAMIYKYMMASIPVPPDLLFPLTTNFSAEFTTTSAAGWADLYGWRYSSSSTSNSKDAEPGRCKRTDGKKWRCSRDVAPNQKYCERHMHRGRPRSRKHVEVQPLVSETNTNKKTRLNSTTPKISTAGQPISQQMVETIVQSNGTNHVTPKMNTDLSVKTFANRGVNWAMEDKVLGIEGVEQQWPTFMNQKIDNHPSLFPQQYEREGLNLISYTDSNGVRDESPSLTLSMAMAAGNTIDGEMEKIQEGGCDFRSKDSIFLSTQSWIPFGSGGGPLAEMLHTSTVSATPSNPASPYTGNGDSISPLAGSISSPSGVQHGTFFTQSDNTMCNVALPPVPSSEVVHFQWLN